MNKQVPKVGFFTVLPTPYRQPLLERLVALEDIDVRVFYMAGGEADRSWTVDLRSDKMAVLERKTYAVKRGKPLYFHVNPGVTDRLAAEDFDLVVVPGWAQPTSIRVLRWCRAHGVPCVVHSETHRLGMPSTMKDRLKRALVRRIVAGAAGGFAVGSAAKAYLAGLGVPEDRIWFFSNTPDVGALSATIDEYKPARAELLSGIDLFCRRAALFVGRLIEAKAPFDLLDAYEKVTSDGLDCGLIIVGDGHLEGAMRERIQSRGLKNVRLLGFREGADLNRVYAAADLFVLPSHQEPWGAVVNEAAAAALPLLVTDVVGAGVDLVKDGENGFRVPVRDTDALAARWTEILSGGRATIMGARSREIAAAWGYDFTVDQFRACVHTILETAG